MYSQEIDGDRKLGGGGNQIMQVHVQKLPIKVVCVCCI